MTIAARLDTLEDVTARIESTLVEEPPLTLVDGGAIASGVDAELDELKTISTTGRQQIAAIEERERAAHRHQFAEGALQLGLRLLH